MDIHEVRRARLRVLVDEKSGGKQSAFAALIERQPDYVSRMLKGKKRLGEELAREIEAKAGKHAGWLDGIEEGPTHWDPQTIQWANWFQTLTPDDRKRMTVMAMVFRQGADFDQIMALLPLPPGSES